MLLLNRPINKNHDLTLRPCVESFLFFFYFSMDEDNLMATPEERRIHIETIRNFPAELEALVKDLTPEQLTTPYLDGEWTVQQIVHHLADSHTNAIVRMKLILTEDTPYLKGYLQDEVADLADVESTPIEASLMILRGLHERWANLFERLSEEDWARVGWYDGDPKRAQSVERILEIYAWHGGNHIDQIKKTLAADD